MNTAVQEDVDVIALSILSGAHDTLFRRVLDLLGKQDLEKEILVTGGGIIPEEDMAALETAGVGRLFGPGTPTPEIVDYIRGWIDARDGSRA